MVELTASETGTEPVTLKLTERKGRAGRVKWGLAAAERPRFDQRMTV